MTEFDPGVSHDEVAKTFAPFIKQQFDRNDPRWRRIEHENARLQRRKRWERLMFGRIPLLWRRRRTQDAVQLWYHRQWLETSLEEQVGSLERSITPCRWKDQRMLAAGVGTKRVHLLFLMRVLALLKPKRVLEIGCGNGLNLFLLAARFPELTIAGLEITAGGLKSIERIRKLARLPDELCRFAPEPLQDVEPFNRVRVVHGNAAAMPFRSGEFDLVYTCLALEQMEEVRSEALVEIARATARHAVMIEPFREWNEDGPYRDYIVANDYFSGRIADLSRFGLQPLHATVDMPCKLTFRPGLVVCRVARQTG